MPIRIPKSVAFLFWMAILTGLAYPAFVTLVAQLAFPARANGSLIVIDGQVRGSSLLAEDFRSPAHFRGRPSATDHSYVGSGATNLGATSGELARQIAQRRGEWMAAYGAEPPEEMLHASASGLDPEISPETALAQVDGVAAARGMGAEEKSALISAIRDAAFRRATIIGPPRVNVVSLNAMLDTAGH